MSNTDKRVEELLEKLGLNAEKLAAAKAMTPRKTSKSRIIVREAMWDIISFIHENRTTILPYTTASYALINEKKSDNEMLTAYLKYMFQDAKEGMDILILMAESLGFDEMMEQARKEKIKRDADIEANGIEMI